MLPKWPRFGFLPSKQTWPKDYRERLGTREPHPNILCLLAKKKWTKSREREADYRHVFVNGTNKSPSIMMPKNKPT